MNARAAPGRAGFSLIELLLAMVVLLMMVVVFARFFQRSTEAWEGGQRSVEVAISGRSAVGLMIGELTRAVGDPVLVHETVADGWGAFQCDGNWVSFIALSPREPYAPQRIHYYVEGERIWRRVGDADPSMVVSNVLYASFGPIENLAYELPAEVTVALRLRNRYDRWAYPNPPAYIRAREQDFTGRAFPVNLQRYPETDLE